MENKGAFDNIERKQAIDIKPVEPSMKDVDVKNSFYKDIIDQSENGFLDLSRINAFTSISQSRDNVYGLLDLMTEDPVISTAVSIYASNACEPNDAGQVVWAESDDPQVLAVVTKILDELNIEKNAYSWAYSLVKYGDVYLRLFRESEFNAEEKDSNQLNEDVILKAFDKKDRYAMYMEAVKNPAEVFDLQQYGKTVSYIRSHIIPTMKTGDTLFPFGYGNNQYNYSFNRNDVDVYEATEFVHASLTDMGARTSEEVTISSNTEDAKQYTYNVRRGKSVLYNSFRIWRTLSLLENSMMLNRITRSSIIRILGIEVADMEPTEVRKLLNRVKMMVEQKTAIKDGEDMTNYINPGPMENTIYMPTKDNQGNITLSSIGGDVEVNAIKDIEYFRDKLCSALGIPKPYLGFTDDSTGFNGGSSLSLISSQFAKSVKYIQNALCQAFTDAVNLILYNRNSISAINAFTIKMQAPSTQEDKDRKESLQTSISNIRDVMDLISNAGLEDTKSKLTILKTMLTGVVTNSDVMSALQDAIDAMDAQPVEGAEDMGDFGEPDFGGDDMGNMSEPLDMGDDLGGEEPPQESFYSGEGEILNEEDDLPTWDSLGLSFNKV